MNFKSIQPSGDLKKYIDSYWYLKIPKMTIREILPSVNTSVCFHLSDKAGYKFITKDLIREVSENNYDFADCIMSDMFLLQNAIIGPHRQIIMETSVNGINTFGIEFKPCVLNSFMGISYDRLANNILSVSHTSCLIQQLHQIIDSCRTEEVFEVVDNYFVHEFLNSDYSAVYDEDLLIVINRILEDPFFVKVRDIADMMNTCERNCNRIFKKFIGLSPKQFLMIHRITKISDVLKNNSDLSAVQLAKMFGYYDLAHLNHDFRFIGGYTAHEVIENMQNKIVNYRELLTDSNFSEKFCLIDLV